MAVQRCISYIKKRCGAKNRLSFYTFALEGTELGVEGLKAVREEIAQTGIAGFAEHQESISVSCSGHDPLAYSTKTSGFAPSQAIYMDRPSHRLVVR